MASSRIRVVPSDALVGGLDALRLEAGVQAACAASCPWGSLFAAFVPRPAARAVLDRPL